MIYPTIQPNIIASNEALSLEALMSYYDKYTALGLYLLPKQKNQKFPLSKYWKDHATPTREGVQSDQLSEGLTGWCIVTGEKSGRLIALDFDTQELKNNGYDPQETFDKLQSLSHSDFVFATPSGGLHVLYRQPQECQALLTNSKTPIKGLDKRGEGGQIASVGAFYRYVGKAAENKGVLDGHGAFYTEVESADYSFVPLMSDDLYNWLISVDKKAVSEGFGRSEVGRQRIKKHFEQPTSEQERIVVSALGAILKDWGIKPYEEWLRMWMSAFDASHGSIVVRDFILAHDDIIWRSFDSNNDGGQEHFREVWSTHEQRDGGYTAASLFWLARQAGWMSTTGYELNNKLADKINVRYVGEWLATLKEIPKRLLLMSQTGSGKTFSLKYLYETLGHPKTVVFVPSIKLALELTSTLVHRHELPAVCYYDQEALTSIDVADMLAAPILVTTLQTFCMKIRLPMSEYGLVYVEESDQLIASFARGGGGRYSTHVSDLEARKGFATLRSAFLNSGVVWCVDATMSQVTYRMANEMSTLPVKTVINTWVEPKAPVLMVDTIGRALQEVLRGLSLGQRVVAVSDTAKQAEEIYDVMDMLGALKSKKALVITRHTETDPDVHAFMQNVNGEAKKYDLVSYNSVMASGVSITDFTPDVVVQFCTYLTPRTNLQLLNRYRQQVKVYCHYRLGENLYTQSDKAILDMAHEQVEVEGRLIAMPIATRNDDATLRDIIGAIAIADTQAQEKSPRDFYMFLLKHDGREVTHADMTPVAGVIQDAKDAVSELRKEQKEMLKSSWILTPPINRDEPVPKGYTDLQIAQGEIHNEIALTLRNNIPKGIDPEYIYDTVNMFKEYGVALTALVHQESAIRKAEEYLADAGKALMSVRNHLTMVKVFSLVRMFYGHLDNKITASEVKERTPNFLMMLAANSQNYDQVITRKNQQYASIMSKDMEYTERALAFCKIILSRVGLKQRSERLSQADNQVVYQYGIANIHQAVEFLTWRNPELHINLDITTQALDAAVTSRRGLTIEDTDTTLALMIDQHTDLETAIQVIKQGDKM